MKKFLTLVLLLTGLIFMGCSEEIGMVEPSGESYSSFNQASVSKEFMFSLPEPDSKRLMKGDIIYSQTETIDGEKGGIH